MLNTNAGIEARVAATVDCDNIKPHLFAFALRIVSPFGLRMLRPHANVVQARTHIGIGDILIPRLISGQLRLAESTTAAEGALA